MTEHDVDECTSTLHGYESCACICHVRRHNFPPTAAALRRLAEQPNALHVIFNPQSDEALYCEIYSPDTDGHDPNRPDWCPYLDPESGRHFNRSWEHWSIATHAPPAPTSHSHWRSP